MAETKTKKSRGRTPNRIGSKSEPDLATAAQSQRIFAGFASATVDDLCHQRRKKPGELKPSDNIQLEEGSFKLLQSEYTESYQPFFNLEDLEEKLDTSPSYLIPPRNTLQLDGLQEFLSEYNESFIPYPLERTNRIDRPLDTFVLNGPNEMEHVTLESDNYFPLITESATQFIPYEELARALLQRRSTNLKLEGTMDTKTETRDQFIPYELEKRPPLIKKFTNLHLEGDMDILTEKQEKYVPYDVKARPVYTKKGTSLHLEGDLSLTPEYRSEFVDHKQQGRRTPALPINNLKTNGFYGSHPDLGRYSTKAHPIIPNLREPITTPTSSRPPSGMRAYDSSQGGELPPLRRQLSRSHQNLYGDSRDADVRQKTQVVSRGKPLKGRRASQSPTKEYGCEYMRSFVEPIQQQPVFYNHKEQLSDAEVEYYMEPHDHYYPSPPNKPKLFKQEPTFGMEGRFECQPEYRRAYVDYLIRERIDRKPRTIDALNNNAPVRRAFDFLTSPDKSTSSLDAKKITTKPPSSSSTSSMNAPKSARSKSRHSDLSRSYSQIEEAAFGPRTLQVPTRKTSSRSSSPQAPSQRGRRRSTRSTTLASASTSSNYNSSFEGSDVPRSKYKKFDSPVRVENLALRPKSPMVARSPSIPPRSKWMRNDSTQSDSSAFYVLEAEAKKQKSARKEHLRSYTDGNLNREHKWMPTWSYSP